MKYFRTQSGKIIDENNQLVNDQDYYNYLANDGTVYSSDYEFPSDIKKALTNKALEIDLYYTNQISELLKKHIEKLNLDGVPIPQIAIDERLRLRAECNQQITDLGITDFSYRKTKLSL